MTVVDPLMVGAEYDAVRLGDARLDARLEKIVAKIAVCPSDSFPEQMDSDADQEALYRFLANSRVTMAALLSGHRERTLQRISEHRVVRIIHDTTEFSFDGDREGVGLLRGYTKGFPAHFSLAVAADNDRESLGVMAVRPFEYKHAQRGLTNSEKARQNQQMPRAEKKSRRWEEVAIECSRQLPNGVEAVHIMDQEADDYSVFSALMQRGLRYVIRADPRRLTADGRPVSAVLAEYSTTPLGEARITRRTRQQATPNRRQVRSERITNLCVRVATITLKRPKYAQEATHDSIDLNAIHVFERVPPREGEEAIEWLLFSSEPMETREQIRDIVDHYRARWIIEEFFKALKTGCAFEKRQLCSLEGLLRALALFVPMAWALLTLRTLGREASPRLATAVLEYDQLKVLRALLRKRRRDLPAKPTVRDAMLGIAALGGHIKNNGDPGWLVLGRGMRRLAEAVEVWTALREM